MHVHHSSTAVTLVMHPPDRPAPRFLCACPSAGGSKWYADDPDFVPRVSSDVEDILLWARRQDVRIKRDNDGEKVRHGRGSTRPEAGTDTYLGISRRGNKVARIWVVVWLP